MGAQLRLQVQLKILLKPEYTITDDAKVKMMKVELVRNHNHRTKLRACRRGSIIITDWCRYRARGPYQGNGNCSVCCTVDAGIYRRTEIVLRIPNLETLSVDKPNGR